MRRFIREMTRRPLAAVRRPTHALRALEELERRTQPSVVVANDDFSDTDGNNPVTVPVLANDAVSGASGPVATSQLNPASVRIVSQPPHGQITIDQTTGDITYTSVGFFMGTDTFRYTVSDLAGDVSNPATVSIIIHRPTANDDFADTDGNNPVTVNVTANDTDPDGNDHLDLTSVAVTTPPVHGTVSVDHSTGAITYTALGNYQGTDTFAYTITDKPGAVSAPGFVTIVIHRPTAVDDAATTTVGKPVAVNVLANDTDPDGNNELNAGSVAVATGPRHGVVSVDPGTGQITYTPAAGFSGTDAFTYTVTDFPGAQSNAATVRIHTDLPAGQHVFATGADAGGAPVVHVYNPDGSLRLSITAYDPSFTGGVRVAVGDVNGDGVPDIITGAGAGGGPHVKVFDSQTGALLRSFMAYDPSFTGGVFVSTGDVNGDGAADIITGAGAGGGPHVKVFDGATGAVTQSFFAYAPGFTGGVSVAGGDVNGDGFADIVTGAGAGGGPHVKAFSGLDGSLLNQFFAYDPAFTGGVAVAVGDTNGDGFADIITGAGASGGPHVKVFSGADGTQLQSFFAAAGNFTGGIRVASGDVNGDGFADIIIGTGSGHNSQVQVFSGINLAPINNVVAFDPSFLGGVYVGSRS
jgi:hypothetical protein